MRKFKAYFQKLYSSFPMENILNYCIISMISIILIVAALALLRPINSEQYRLVTQYSKQATCPKTQKIAVQLQHQERIKRIEYLRLLRAYHFENSHVKKYPAVDITDPE